MELAAVNTAFRRRIEGAVDGVARRLGEALEEGRRRGDLPPEADPVQTANVILDCWEGAALRSRVLRGPAPLEAVLDLSFRSALAA
jgi:TetR/AcrR family transcriptional repressor of nem operon